MSLNSIQKQFWFPPELWNHIREYMFHNIKFGKHLKKNKENILYNKVVHDLPRFKIRENWWPNVMFLSKKNWDQYFFYKFIYYLYFSNKTFVIIVYSCKPIHQYVSRTLEDISYNKIMNFPEKEEYFEYYRTYSQA